MAKLWTHPRQTPARRVFKLAANDHDATSLRSDGSSEIRQRFPFLRSISSRRSTVCSESSDTSSKTLVEDFAEYPTPSDSDFHKQSSDTESTKQTRTWRSRLPPVASILQISVTVGEATDLPYLKGIAGICSVLTSIVQVRFVCFHHSSFLTSQMI